MFNMIRIGTAKLRTAKIGNNFGAINGKIYESNSMVATIEFTKNTILFKMLSFFTFYVLVNTIIPRL